MADELRMALAEVQRKDGVEQADFMRAGVRVLAQELMELELAEHANTEKPRGHIPRPLARAVLRTPGLSRLGRGPLAFLDVLDHAVQYDATNTVAALAGTGVRCPPLTDYLPVLVRYVLDATRGAGDVLADLAEEDVSDPLDGAS